MSPSRCVLILGDEGLQIYNVTRLNAQFVEFLSWDTVDFESSVRDLIIKKCKRKPVVILNDMVEQHYRKERIPKVSILDRGNILKRRLGVAFPHYRVRAALKLKDRKTGFNEAGKGDSYLFAAIPNSDPFNKTLEAIRQSSAPIVGFYLLPVEASAMVKILSSKLKSGGASKSAWTIFVGQHHGGGLRQIVTRNGELALTRMTPIVDTDVEPELWAKEVIGELTATMSYLSRFGYQESDGLDVVIVANESSSTSLSSLITIECNLQLMTSQQVAAKLGTRLGHQEDLRYADPLYAGYLGAKSKFLLPMKSMAIEHLTQPRRVASFIMLALLAGCAYFGFNVFTDWKKYIETEDRLVVAVQQNSSLREEYNRELRKKKQLGFDFAYVNNSIEIFNELQAKKIKPLPLIREISRSLGADIHLDNFVVKADEAEVKAREGDLGYNQLAEKQSVTYLDAIFTISFPNTIDPDVGVEKINQLKERLESNLPDYEIAIVRQVADLSYTGNFVGEAGTSTSQQSTPEEYIAEINIRGRVR